MVVSHKNFYKHESKFFTTIYWQCGITRQSGKTRKKIENRNQSHHSFSFRLSTTSNSTQYSWFAFVIFLWTLSVQYIVEFPNVSQLLRTELSRLCIRRGVQGISQKIRTARRQAILHSGHRNSPREQPAKLLAGAILQHGIMGSNFKEVNCLVGSDHWGCLAGGNRKEAPPRPSLYPGCWCRSWPNGRICQHSLSLCSFSSHWGTTECWCVSTKRENENQNEIEEIKRGVPYASWDKNFKLDTTF